MVTCRMTGGHIEWTACREHTRLCAAEMNLDDLVLAIQVAAGCTECSWHWGTNWVEQ